MKKIEDLQGQLSRLANYSIIQGELNLSGMLLREKMRQPGRAKGISKAALAREMKALFVRLSLLESGSS